MGRGKYILAGIALVIVGAVIWFVVQRDDNNEEKELPEDKSEMLVDAAVSIDEARAFLLNLEYDGPSVSFADDDVLPVPVNLKSIRGQFVTPNSFQAEVGVTVGDSSTTVPVNVIAIEDNQYINSNVVTVSDQWIELTFTDFQPADLQNPSDGIGTALKAVQDVVYEGETKIDGIEVYHLKGQIEAARVRSLTVGLIGTRRGLLDVDIYLRQADWNLARIILREPPNEDGEQGIWTIDFSRYNDDSFTVEVPDVVSNES